jgi:hypothetical protein
MHLNALYRAAQSGKRALDACMTALLSATKWNGYAPRALVGKPLKYWHLRQAKGQLEEAKQHLQLVRDNISVLAKTVGDVQQIDSSGGYAVADLLAGGLLDVLWELRLERSAGVEQLDIVRVQVDQLILRMRKAGAVGGV